MSEPTLWQDAVRQQPLTTPREENREVLRRRYGRWTFWLTMLNVVVTLGAVTLILDFSDDWWLSGLLVHTPQIPWLVPSLALLACSLVWHLRSGLINLTCFGIVLFTLCGYRVSLKPLSRVEPSPSLVRVATCHVSDNADAVTRLLNSLRTRQVDVIALQGVVATPKLDERFYAKWQSLAEGEYWVASRWPLKRICVAESPTFERVSAINVAIAHPSGEFVLTNLRLTSAKGMLNELSASSLLLGPGRRAFESHLMKREREAAETRASARYDETGPQLVVGDFGVHPSSKVFRRHFGHLTDAFDTAGVSFGYTSPQLGGRFWPPRVAWMRSDMILSSPHWEPLSCYVIEARGFDHNAVFAELKLRDR